MSRPRPLGTPRAATLAAVTILCLVAGLVVDAGPAAGARIRGSLTTSGYFYEGGGGRWPGPG